MSKRKVQRLNLKEKVFTLQNVLSLTTRYHNSVDYNAAPDLPMPLPTELEFYRDLKTVYHLSDVLLESPLLSKMAGRQPTVPQLLDCVYELFVKFIECLPQTANPKIVSYMLGLRLENVSDKLINERKAMLDTLVLGVLTHCRACDIEIKSPELTYSLLDSLVDRVRENISLMCQSLQLHQRLIHGSNNFVVLANNASVDCEGKLAETTAGIVVSAYPAASHLLRQFIQNTMNSYYQLDANGFVPLTDFYRRFRESTPEFNRQGLVWSPEYYNTVFAYFGLCVEPATTKCWEGEERFETWIKGVAIKGF
jgi:hypothetical protein